MTAIAVGMQLGDEGKGGIVDRYAAAADVVVRYQGGDNAGHTVVVDGEEYKLSLVPSGAVRGKPGVLGNGCVVNPRTLFDELDGLRERGLDPTVRVAKRAHAILPSHRVLDGLEEDTKADSDLQAGTTGRGIGPTYEDKVGRRGVRVCDLLDADVLAEKLDYLIPHQRTIARELYGVDPDAVDGPEDWAAGEAFDRDGVFERYAEFGRRLDEEGLAVDCGAYLAERAADGDDLLFEGAQGSSIDIDHGIYPFVTSSNPTAGGAATGTGLGPGVVGEGEVVGVVKAYLSRVGTGPLPTELAGDLAERIREAGGEYGTVTGRPRRVGWLDVPMLRHAARANGVTGVAINHLDTLAGLEEVKVGHAYECRGETLETMPASVDRWGDCEPVYRSFEGWPDADWDQVAAQGYEALPENARTYVEYVEAELGVDAIALGVGPGRESTVVRRSPF